MIGLFSEEKWNGCYVKAAEEKDMEPVTALLKKSAAWLKEKGVYQWTYLLHAENNEEIPKDILAGNTYVVKKDNKYVATFTIYEEPSEWDYELWKDNLKDAYYLHRFTVNRTYKNQNVGSELLQWIIAHLEGKDCLRLDCVADNKILNEFYLQAGFTLKAYKNYGTDKMSLYEKQLW